MCVCEREAFGLGVTYSEQNRQTLGNPLSICIEKAIKKVS